MVGAVAVKDAGILFEKINLMPEVTFEAGVVTALPTSPPFPTPAAQPDPSAFGAASPGGRIPLRETSTMARLRLLGPAGKRYATARDPKNLARAVISAREYAAATAATNPVPRRLPHSMPLRLQPFLRRAPPVPILGHDHVLHPYNLYTPSSEPRPPSRIDTLLLPTRCTRHPRLPPPPNPACAYYLPQWFRRSRPLSQCSLYCAQLPLFSPITLWFRRSHPDPLVHLPAPNHTCFWFCCSCLARLRKQLNTARPRS